MKRVLLASSLLLCTVALTGCGKQIDNKQLAKNDQLWTIKGEGLDEGMALEFDKNNTGKIINLYDGKKEADFTYMIASFKEMDKLYLCVAEDETLTLKVNKDNIENKEFTAKAEGTKVTFKAHKKDYAKEFQKEEFTKEQKDAKALMKKVKIKATRVNGYGKIKFEDAYSGDLATSDIEFKGNGSLKTGDKVTVKVKSPFLNKVVYEEDITVPELMPEDATKIKNLKAIKDKMIAEANQSFTDSTEENDETSQYQQKKTPFFYYNTKRGVIALVYENASRSRHRYDEDEDWDDWSEWDTSYDVSETKLLTIKNGEVDINHMVIDSLDYSTYDYESSSPEELLEESLEYSSSYSDYSDFVKIK